MNRKTTRLRSAMAIGFVMIMTGTAPAKDPANAVPPPALPGVDGDYRIVRPMPEPEAPDPQEGSRFKVGDTDVRIGGSITVDIGTGDLARPRR